MDIIGYVAGRVKRRFRARRFRATRDRVKARYLGNSEPMNLFIRAGERPSDPGALPVAQVYTLLQA